MPIATVLDEEPKVAVKPLIETSAYRSYRAYVDAGFEHKAPRSSVLAPYEKERRFLSQVVLDKGPINRKIRTMKRFKVDNKEYLIFTEDWRANNWLGKEINPVLERIEGRLFLPKVVPHIDERGQKIGKDLDGQIIKHEIPFSKENVDKWINEIGTPIEEIKFYVEGSGRKDNKATYDQFLYPWNQALDTLMKDGAFEADYVEGLKKKPK